MSDQAPRVLVVEDEPQMRRFLRTSLSSRGFEVLEAPGAAEAITQVTSYTPDLMLLDLVLPDGDGLSVTRSVREWSRMPIIVISARGREADKVEALDAGADDYLTKPFGVDELLARMRVALRHAEQARGSPQPVLEVGPLKIDVARHEVWREGAQVHLTPIEFRLLRLLAQNAGKVLTHTQLLNEVWGPGHSGQSHYLRVYLAQLRRKIERDPARPQWLVTELGVGYRLRDRAP